MKDSAYICVYVWLWKWQKSAQVPHPIINRPLVLGVSRGDGHELVEVFLSTGGWLFLPCDLYLWPLPLPHVHCTSATWTNFWFLKNTQLIPIVEPWPLLFHLPRMLYFYVFVCLASWVWAEKTPLCWVPCWPPTQISNSVHSYCLSAQRAHSLHHIMFEFLSGTR